LSPFPKKPPTPEDVELFYIKLLSIIVVVLTNNIEKTALEFLAVLYLKLLLLIFKEPAKFTKITVSSTAEFLVNVQLSTSTSYSI